MLLGLKIQLQRTARLDAKYLISTTAKSLSVPSSASSGSHENCKSMKPRLPSEASVPRMLFLLRPCVEHYFSARTDFWFRVKLQ